jgi:hypothetical protein
MALNFNPDRDGREVKLATDLRAIERHLDDDHYVRWAGPGDFEVFNTATKASNNAWPVVQFPDAASTSAQWTFPKPSEWRGGPLLLRMWHTSTVGDTKTFSLAVSVRALRSGEVLPATVLLNTTIAPAGPAVANTVLVTADLYTTTSLGGDDQLFSVRITRDGAGDSNNNPWQLLLLRVEHIPAVREAQ